MIIENGSRTHKVPTFPVFVGTLFLSSGSKPVLGASEDTMDRSTRLEVWIVAVTCLAPIPVLTGALIAIFH
jgi:hypothetical protein